MEYDQQKFKMREDKKDSKWKTTKKYRMEDIKKIKMGDDPKIKWKMTKTFKMEDDQKDQNRRQPKVLKIKDDPKNQKWKTTNEN